MRNLLIHNPTNSNTRYYRDYNLFWDELTEELKKKYNVTENRFFENAHFEKMKIFLKKRTFDFLELLECEYVIEDLDSGDFWIMSVSDQLSSGILKEQSNPYLKKVLYSQYVPDQMVHHCRGNVYKYHPWIYFPQNVFDFDKIYEKRKSIENPVPKLFFKGVPNWRPIINHINKDIMSSNDVFKIGMNDYFDLLINHKICLSVGGAAIGSMCYRDIECMAIGIPILRFDFTNTIYPSLIPNYHYISIPIQLDFPKENDILKDRLGNEKHAKLIEDRFNQVINNKDFLNFISKNSRKYYENFLSKENRIKHTLELLEL